MTYISSSSSSARGRPAMADYSLHMPPSIKSYVSQGSAARSNATGTMAVGLWAFWYLVGQEILGQNLHSPELRASAIDALRLAAKIPPVIPMPDVWTDGEAELAFEWIEPSGKHAFISFDGDGAFGYTMKIGDRFVPGAEHGTTAQFPRDLLKYLNE